MAGSWEKLTFPLFFGMLAVFLGQKGPEEGIAATGSSDGLGFVPAVVEEDEKPGLAIVVW